MAKFKPGYSGKPFHILRNGQVLNLYDYFIGNVSFIKVSILPNNTSSYGNISINLLDGEISATAQVAADNIYNFQVHAIDQNNGEEFDIQIYLHDTLERIWLTPEALSVKNGFDNVRFSIYARFKDHIDTTDFFVMADLSEMKEFKWSKITGSFPSNLSLDADTGRIGITTAITVPSSTPISCVKIELKTGSLFGTSVTAEDGKLVLALNNSELLHVIAAPKEVATRSNYLFIADGFTAAEKDIFTSYVAAIVKQINTNENTSPWNLFETQNNFWQYFIESRESGGSLIDEHVLLRNLGSPARSYAISVDKFQGVANYIVTELKKPATADTITKIKARLELDDLKELADFLNFGTDLLPVPSAGGRYLPNSSTNLTRLILNKEMPNKLDKDATASISSLTTNRTAMINKWETINPGVLLDDDTVQGYLHPFVFYLWSLMGERVYLALPDTALGSFEGKSPNLSDDGRDSLEQHNYKLSSREKLNSVISALTYTNTKVQASNVPLGKQFYNTGPLDRGKDANNTIILTKTQAADFLGLSIFDPKSALVGTGCRRTSTILGKTYSALLVTESVPNQIYKTDNVSLSNNISFVAKNTAIHELSHNWLKDEYAGYTGVTSGNFDQLPKVVRADINNSLQYTNLITNYHPNETSGPGIDAAYMMRRLKWRLPRMRKVGILAGQLQLESGKYKVRIPKNGIAFGDGLETFKELEDVYLRGVLFEHPSVVQVGTDFVLYCPKFKIDTITVDPSNSSLLLFSLTYQANLPNAPELSHFPAKSILFSPRLGDNNEVLEMVHKDIRSGIINSNRLLRAQESDPSTFAKPQYPALTSDELSQNIKDFAVPKNKERLVGLFEAGELYHTGIYHASGFCIMRTIKEQNGQMADNPDTVYTANAFCPICKYILVEQINPLKHPKIDDEYEKYYPKK